LHACGDKDLKNGIPRKPFYARDLELKVYERVLAVAKAAGVEEGALLDAAALDVAVIGDDKAAQVFVGAPTQSLSGNSSAHPAKVTGIHEGIAQTHTRPFKVTLIVYG